MQRIHRVSQLRLKDRRLLKPLSTRQATVQRRRFVEGKLVLPPDDDGSNDGTVSFHPRAAASGAFAERNVYSAVPDIAGLPFRKIVIAWSQFGCYESAC